MNNVALTGRLTKDPVVSVTTGQNPISISRFTIAVDRNQKKEEGKQNADFISIKALGKTAEWAGRYLHKGMKVEAVGRLESGSYVSREGQKVYYTDVIASQLEFAESKAASAGYAAPVQAAAPAAQMAQAAAPQAAAPADAEVPMGFADISGAAASDDGLPFI